MKATTKTVSKIAAGMLALVACAGIVEHAEAQDPLYVLSILAPETVTGAPGSTVEFTAIVQLDNSAGEPSSGLSFGVAHSGLGTCTITALAEGADSQALNGGAGADFFVPAIHEGGATLGLVVSFLNSDVFDPGTHEVALLTIEATIPPSGCTTCELFFVDFLGDPPVATVVVVGGASIPPDLEPGAIELCAADPDYVLSILAPETVTGTPGSTVEFTAIVQLDNTMGGAVQELSFGVAHSGLGTCTVTAVAQGADSQALNGGAGPDFFEPTIVAGGATLGLDVSILDSDAFDPGTHEVALLTLEATIPPSGCTTCELTFTDALGSPPVSVVVVVGGSSILPVPENDASELCADSDYVLSILAPETVTGAPGSMVEFTAIVQLDNTLGGPVEALSFGVAHSGAGICTITAVAEGADSQSLNGGAGPDFFVPTILADGATLALVASFLGNDAFAPGTHEVALLTIEATIPPSGCITCLLIFTDILGSPTVPVVVIVGGASIVPEQENDASELCDAPGYADSACQIGKLVAGDGAVSDHFGDFVAISGITAIVGAPLHDDNGADSGSAHIFRKDGEGNWLEIDEITPTNPEAGDLFGFRVGLSGDTAVVSAYGDADNGTLSGSAYIFREVDGVWTQIAKLTANDAAAEDRFGWSAAISGDTVIVGAWGHDDNGSGSGSAYIFQRDFGGPDNWGQVVKLTADDGEEGDKFGISAAISGNTVIVGARDDDDLGDRSGSVYIFREIDGVWMPLIKLTAIDGAALDRFGRSVGISGDTAIVGAWGNDDNGSRSGSAYVLREIDGVWAEITKITDDDAAAEDRFGISVAMSGDIAVIGAYFDDAHAGSASVFVEIEGVWTQLDKLTAVDRAPEDRFGTSVAISGATTIVGALLDDDNGNDSGSAYLFDLTDTDSDGVADGCDECPGFDDGVDTDKDGVPDGCDICPGGDDGVDTDGDGVPDDCDICPGGDDGVDTDGDGVPDDCDICPGGDDGVDTDGDGIPDHCDICDEADGDCLVANGTPGCNGLCGGEPCLNGSCCELICANDPFCCGLVWGEACATAAQGFCNSLFWIEDVESYAPDSSLHGQGGWQGWEDDEAFTAFVSEDVNHTEAGSQSIKIEGASDLVREFAGHSNGVWLFTAWQYIPSTFANSPAASYFILLKSYNDDGFHNWSVQLRFDPFDGMIHCDCGESDSAQMPFNVDVWQKIEVVIDLDNDWAQVYYDDSLIGGYPWTKGVFGNDGPCHSAGCIGAVDLFANDSSAVYYDDLSLEVLTEPFGACCEGQSCSNTLETDCSFDFTPGVICQTDESSGQVCPIPDCLNADGDCFEDNGTQGCNNQCDGVPCEIENCCSRVCVFDPFCCEILWDSQCAGFAQIVCTIPELPPFGACCFAADCGELTESDCSARGGVFLGDATDCGVVSYSIEACESPFNDISDIGIEAPNACFGDADGDVVPIGFDFSFFNENHDMVGISRNGYLSFGTVLGAGHNHPIPEAIDPDDFIAPFWDGFLLGAHGCVHYLTQGGTFTTQWTEAQHIDAPVGSYATFQAVLEEGTNCIEFRYGDLWNSATPTIGVENQDGTEGFPGGYGPVVAAGDCLRLCPGPVLPANPCLCTSGEDCEDGNLCTFNTCDPDNPNADEFDCVSEDVDCDDAVGCTIDACDPKAGCSNAPDDTLCDDNDACTIDSCDPETDCVHTPNYDPAAECCDPATGATTPIDDGNACTEDVCDPETGDVSHDENYDPATECCNPETGDIVLIDDGNACTIDACDPVSGQVLHIDNFNPDTQCCDPATGDITPIDDDDACTDDVCDAETGQVTHTPVVCPDGEVCDPETGKCTAECGLCPTDSSGDGNTGAADLASLLACWGPVVPGCECFDANGDGGIGPLDLATLLAAWGPCP